MDNTKSQDMTTHPQNKKSGMKTEPMDQNSALKSSQNSDGKPQDIQKPAVATPVSSSTTGNSPMDHSHLNLISRHQNIFNPEEDGMSVTIVGAGSIGSNLALLLARLGLKNITVYDFDSVEDHNLGHQAFRLKDIKRPKVEALQEIILEATGIEIKAIPEMTDGKDIKTDVLIFAVDSMSARDMIFKNATFSFAVDGRMGGETFNCYAFGMMDSDRYVGTLYSDEDASDLPCGGKSIGYISYIIAGIMENTIKKIMKGEPFPFEQNFCAKNLIYSVTK